MISGQGVAMRVNRRSTVLRLVLGIMLVCVLGMPCWAAGPKSRTSLGSKQGVAIEQWSYWSGKLLVKGRLYVPVDRAGRRLPVVIFCHDGISGISREHELSSIRLANAGYVVFSPSYRGEDGSQGMVEIAKGEVDDVLAVLPLLASVPQADQDKVVLMGASHGALISLLAASRCPAIRGVVFAYGVADIYAWWDYLKAHRKLGRDVITRRTYGDGPDSRPESFRMRNGVAVAEKVACPVLILQGQLDTTTPPQQAVLLQRRFAELGKECKLHIYPDALHGFLVYAPYLTHDVTRAEKRQAEQAWQETVSFLRKVVP